MKGVLINKKKIKKHINAFKNFKYGDFAQSIFYLLFTLFFKLSLAI